MSPPKRSSFFVRKTKFFSIDALFAKRRNACINSKKIVLTDPVLNSPEIAGTRTAELPNQPLASELEYGKEGCRENTVLHQNTAFIEYLLRRRQGYGNISNQIMCVSALVHSDNLATMTDQVCCIVTYERAWVAIMLITGSKWINRTQSIYWLF